MFSETSSACSPTGSSRRSSFDVEALKRMFEADPNSREMVARKQSIKVLERAKKKAVGVKLLSDHRARNIAIVLRRLSVSTRDLARILKNLRWEVTALSSEDLEQVLEVIPSQDEAETLRQHKDPEDSVQLRDVEQMVLPLALLKRGAARVRLLVIARTSKVTYQTTARNFDKIREACHAIHKSAMLREVMLLALEVGNYINHGDSKRGAKAISVGSLLTLKDFKAGKLSSLHFLCASLHRAEPTRDAAEVLSNELRAVVQASKLQVQTIQSDARKLQRDLEIINAECQNFVQEYATRRSRVSSAGSSGIDGFGEDKYKDILEEDEDADGIDSDSNRFGDEGVVALAQVFRHQRGKKKDLQSFVVEPQLLAQWILQVGMQDKFSFEGGGGHGVQQLDLSFNMVTDIGGQALAGALEDFDQIQPTCIQFINVYDTSIGNAGRLALEDCVKAGHTRTSAFAQLAIGMLMSETVASVTSLPWPLRIAGLEFETMDAEFTKQAQTWSSLMPCHYSMETCVGNASTTASTSGGSLDEFVTEEHMDESVSLGHAQGVAGPCPVVEAPETGSLQKQAYPRKMTCGCVGQVVKSLHSGFPVGSIVNGQFGWCDYAVSDGAGVRILPPDWNRTWALGVLGMPGATAYYGLLEIIDPQPGETIVVSSCTGAVGMLVGQIAKIKGCRTIGFTSAGKEALAREFGYDEVICYSGKDIKALIRELRAVAPKGVNGYFDNSGGVCTEATLMCLAQFARVSVCGQIA